jgi:hypothetical protein
MPNTCRVLITRGKNKGTACYVVNKKCRHKNIVCLHCGVPFTVETSYIRHKANCHAPEVPFNRIKLNIGKEPRKETQNNEITNNAPIEEPMAYNLLRKIEKLEKELELVKNTPSVHHHWNIVLGMNFFEELVGKMGKDHAINFLTEIASEGKPVDVISKLYLEGNNPTCYPIACRDRDHFRYIDSDHRLIDDRGGHSISQIVSSGVYKALILAANEQNHTVAPIQKYVSDMMKSLPQDRIINELSHITSIPNHPFFKDSDMFMLNDS